MCGHMLDVRMTSTCCPKTSTRLFNFPQNGFIICKMGIIKVILKLCCVDSMRWTMQCSLYDTWSQSGINEWKRLYSKCPIHISKTNLIVDPRKRGGDSRAFHHRHLQTCLITHPRKVGFLAENRELSQTCTVIQHVDCHCPQRKLCSLPWDEMPWQCTSG